MSKYEITYRTSEEMNQRPHQHSMIVSADSYAEARDKFKAKMNPAGIEAWIDGCFEVQS